MLKTIRYITLLTLLFMSCKQVCACMNVCDSLKIQVKEISKKEKQLLLKNKFIYKRQGYKNLSPVIISPKLIKNCYYRDSVAKYIYNSIQGKKIFNLSDSFSYYNGKRLIPIIVMALGATNIWPDGVSNEIFNIFTDTLLGDSRDSISKKLIDKGGLDVSYCYPFFLEPPKWLVDTVQVIYENTSYADELMTAGCILKNTNSDINIDYIKKKLLILTGNTNIVDKYITIITTDKKVSHTDLIQILGP